MRSSFYFNIVFLSFILIFDISLAKNPPESFADLASKVSPAVVNIATTTNIGDLPNSQMPEFPPGSPFEEFFKDFMERGPSKRPSQSLGSGFIISSDGLIVTNNHVIDNADEIKILLSDEREFNAKVVGRDSKTDIALLKVDPNGIDLPFVEFGNSENLRVGDWVLAVGNPFGLGGSVTAGIVSARGREIGQGQYDDFIQTDASINRGNSGGPLFDMEGNVIGINTAIFSQSGGSIGIGFAIASNLADQVVSQLKKYGRTKRGWLGVYIQEVTEEIAASLALKEVRGALVSSVRPGSPAEVAKFLAGDVVLSFKGKPINKMRELPRVVAETPVGEKVKVEIWRDEKLIELFVVLGELEKAENKSVTQNNNDIVTQENKKIALLGLEISNINSALAEKFNIDEKIGKVIIINVDEGGPSYNKFIKPGEIIKRAGRREVNGINDVILALDSAIERNAKALLLLISDGQKERFVAVNINKN